MGKDSSERLVSFRNSLGMSQTAFAASLGFSQGTVSHIEKGSAKPSRNFLTKISDTYRISADWLLYGRGEMFHEPEIGIAPGNPNTGRITPPDRSRPVAGDFAVDGDEYSLIRRITINVSAGPGILFDGEEHDGALAFSRQWLTRNSISAQLAGLVRVKGDSMTPTIPDGALVLVHAAEMTVTREGIFAYSRDGQAFIKRLVPSDLDEAGRARTIAIVSDNRDYPVEVLVGDRLNEIRIAGRIRCAMVDL